ncbi:DUF4386 domain-containing protein [Herpetosiphon llansteffanensis]|uniref:DUF4386 domain-containing protein n=1 Tax=Herpetosiphon llansteffanensis TaxID=2094568 RepID=UPI000D7CECF1|nr:DUF4386 domain-containing protein [Herpetosiphon llansteffanensis]
MTDKYVRQLTGWSLILGSLLVNIPYTLLISNFDYPDILRAPVDQVLRQFAAGGSGLIYTWLAFAWVGLPLLFASIMLKRLPEFSGAALSETASTIGVIGFVMQVVGLLRWVFVVPLIAQSYLDPLASATTKASLATLFQVVHQYGGVVLGEHIGQLFMIIWMLLLSTIIYRSMSLPKWLAWLGWLAALIYSLAQTELLATVLPTIPVIAWAGLVGSLLWLAWMASLGIIILRQKNAQQLDTN